MKKIKDQNGAIAVLVLVSVIFVVSFLISAYTLISNKVKTQKEIILETKNIYETEKNMEEIYNSYFNNSNIIPIYTVEQLLDMGTGKENVNIDGKYYNFTNDENTIYVLMNDLKFKASDYSEKLDNGYWMPVGDRILSYESTLEHIGNAEETLEGQFKAKFEGRNNNIEVIYTDEENDEYSVIYSESSNYCEPEYNVNITPLISEGVIAENAEILENDKQTGLNGIATLQVKRKEQTSISAYLNDNYTRPMKNILIINPNKIETVNLEFESLNVTLKIQAIPENAKVVINGQETNTINVPKQTEINYEITLDGYYSDKGVIEVNNNKTIEIELSPIDYVSFSETLYFTRCSDEKYSGLLNGGEATIEKYDLGGADYPMGTFYIDETDVIKKIPSKAIVKKVTLYFDYYQTRNNTFLYTNTIKTSLYTGTTERMAQKETERTNKTVQTAKYELYNINRKDLEGSISVNLINYIEGTLKITSSVKNMYCVIEGEKPEA